MPDPSEALLTQTKALSPADRAAALESARLALLVMLDNNEE
jgi:hypothetical protein